MAEANEKNESKKIELVVAEVKHAVADEGIVYAVEFDGHVVKPTLYVMPRSLAERHAREQVAITDRKLPAGAKIGQKISL